MNNNSKQTVKVGGFTTSPKKSLSPAKKSTSSPSKSSSSSPLKYRQETRYASPTKRTNTQSKNDVSPNNKSRSIEPKRNPNSFVPKSPTRTQSPGKKTVGVKSNVKSKKNTTVDSSEGTETAPVSIETKNLSATELNKLSEQERVEYEVLCATNFVRCKPADAAVMLKERLKYFQGNLYVVPGETMLMTMEGPTVVQETIEFLEKQKPLPPIPYSRGASLACRDHCNDTGPTGKVGHDSTDGSSFSDRMSRYGKNGYGMSGENISYGYDSGMGIVLQLIIDDGVLSRGHRSNIFSTQFNCVGIGFGKHKSYRSMCVCDYGFDYMDKSEYNNINIPSGIVPIYDGPLVPPELQKLTK